MTIFCQASSVAFADAIAQTNASTSWPKLMSPYKVDARPSESGGRQKAQSITGMRSTSAQPPCMNAATIGSIQDPTTGPATNAGSTVPALAFTQIFWRALEPLAAPPRSGPALARRSERHRAAACSGRSARARARCRERRARSEKKMGVALETRLRGRLGYVPPLRRTDALDGGCSHRRGGSRLACPARARSAPAAGSASSSARAAQAATLALTAPGSAASRRTCPSTPPVGSSPTGKLPVRRSASASSLRSPVAPPSGTSNSARSAQLLRSSNALGAAHRLAAGEFQDSCRLI